MPIKIIDDLPAKTQLSREHIFTIEQLRAQSQDIRPLQILILNLMPLKQTTEVQLLRLLGNSPLQVDVDFMHMSSHESKNTEASHLQRFYKTFDEVRNYRYDGLIITGAPVETIPFESVDYWDELTQIMTWSNKAVYSTLHICWGAQAGLYHHYGIEKKLLNAKCFGIFEHDIHDDLNELVRGFDDTYHIPQSRHTGIVEKQVYDHNDLYVLSSSNETGINIVTDYQNRKLFVLGHFEYDTLTLAKEYFRDLSKGQDIELPKNYFPNDDVNKKPVANWKAHGNLFFTNWLNLVYQWTPFDLRNLVESNR